MKYFEMFLVTHVGLMPITVKSYVSTVKRVTSVIGVEPDKYMVEKYVIKRSRYNFS